MAAPGIFSIDACMYSIGACNFDCKELMRADCNISKCGVGGPLINMYGQVIGINFYDLFYTPFLPIDIVRKCLKHFEETGYALNC
ncbi:putative protease Do-like 14 [Rosa rugosa]|uniref:putative protease Do-like 14 n=1 Tax=Rosa rugosa TaxID=74645 RepID=UPI002B40ECE6|nr:putative protease Do-like 14 [Rosa rugosa]